MLAVAAAGRERREKRRTSSCITVINVHLGFGSSSPGAVDCAGADAASVIAASQRSREREGCTVLS